MSEPHIPIFLLKSNILFQKPPFKKILNTPYVMCVIVVSSIDTEDFGNSVEDFDSDVIRFLIFIIILVANYSYSMHVVLLVELNFHGWRNSRVHTYDRIVIQQSSNILDVE